MITVWELIEKLKDAPPGMMVVVDGYEAGYAEDIQAGYVFLRRNRHGDTDGIYGRHGNNVGPGNLRGDPRVEAGRWDMKAFYVGEGRGFPWEKEEREA